MIKKKGRTERPGNNDNNALLLETTAGKMRGSSLLLRSGSAKQCTLLIGHLPPLESGMYVHSMLQQRSCV